MQRKPDLILINLSDPVEDRHEFCRSLKSAHATSGIGVIAVGVADTSAARLAALDAGADDVLPRPMNDTLLLARIRSLLRVRSASQELLLRDSTSRALGFEDANRSFETAAHVAVITYSDTVNPQLADALDSGMGHPLRRLQAADVLRETDVKPVPDLFLIDCTASDDHRSALFRLVSDLRCRSETRLSALLVMVPDGQPDMASMLLDLGADDVAQVTTSSAEITLRARALIRRKLLHDRLRDTVRNGLHAAITDSLTGLYNRRYVESHLARMAEQSRASDTEMAVMMLDIDHFKQVNDTYGHAAGDRVLVQIADRLRENLRAIDLVARIGGEEFLIAMPRTSQAQARNAADRLRRLVNSQPFDLGDGGPPLEITVSVGVAISGAHGVEQRNIGKMCDQADAALYAAKSAGRNQVAVSKSAA